jgi:hypothetical protein
MKNLATALVKAQKAFSPALKNSTNPHFKSRYADLATCVEAVMDALNDNGIALIQKCYECPSGIMVETVFMHESGEIYESGILQFPASKQDPQGYMSALTYARRGSLMAACGIAPEDDDGNAATFRKTKNPLDAVAPVQQQSSAPALPLYIPGKDDPHSEHPDLASWAQAYEAMMGKIEGSAKIDVRERMTKLRELREANEQRLEKMDVSVKAKLVADYNLRLKRLGVQQ